MHLLPLWHCWLVAEPRLPLPTGLVGRLLYYITPICDGGSQGKHCAGTAPDLAAGGGPTCAACGPLPRAPPPGWAAARSSCQRERPLPAAQGGRTAPVASDPNERFVKERGQAAPRCHCQDTGTARREGVSDPPGMLLSRCSGHFPLALSLSPTCWCKPLLCPAVDAAVIAELAMRAGPPAEASKQLPFGFADSPQAPAALPRSMPTARLWGRTAACIVARRRGRPLPRRLPCS